MNRPIPIITRVNSNELIPQPRASQIEKNNNVMYNNNKTPQLSRSHSHNPYNNNYNNPPIHNYNLLEEDNKYLLFEVEVEDEQYELYDKLYDKYDLELLEKIDDFWTKIDIASNKKIPFEILKISLRVKSIGINENNW
eukprot:405786_1